MAKTMEHQASIHRQQMREREVGSLSGINADKSCYAVLLNITNAHLGRARSLFSDIRQRLILT